MDWKKVLRVFVCLALVCALLIGVSPIKARAVDPITITAAAILGATILGLSAYCGFVLAPPDVDFVEDVGEEFNDFIQVVINTGGMPDDDDDDSNNPIDDLVDQITSSTVSQIKTYTDAVGDAIKGNTTFYDAAVFGGFAGLEPAFKLFLKWMILNGYLDRTVDVPVNPGWAYYGDLFFPEIPTFDEYPFVRICSRGNGEYTVHCSDVPLYSESTKLTTSWFMPATACEYIYATVYPANWDVTTTYSFKDPISISKGNYISMSGAHVWSNYDVFCYKDNSLVHPAGPEPSYTSPEEERVDATVILGPLSSSIVNGMEAAGIPLPENVNFVKLFDGHALDGVAALYRNLTQYSQSLADGSITLEHFQDELTYKEPEQPDETEPSAPTVDPDPTSPTQNIPFDGTLGGTPVGDFLTNLGNLIMAPFEWIWNQIKNLFSPWIDSIGDWFSQVRSDIQALPGKFQQWFHDIIDGIKTLPDKFEQWLTDIIDGIKTLPDKILEGLQKLFFPSNDYLSDKVDYLTGNFAFADSIVKTGQALHLGLAGVTTEPPVIYIDLGAARGFHDIGGRVPFLDLRWYAEYKPTVDTIISAFLWICFVWRMLLKLPGIISGMPGDFNAYTALDLGLTPYLPQRSAMLERTRIFLSENIRKKE